MQDAATRFSMAARQHGISTLEGDAKETNDAHSEILRAAEELRRNPDHGVGEFRKLLNYEDASVVTWAALHLLPYEEQLALEVLDAVANSGLPRVAFGARITIQEWKAGRLKVS